MLFSRRSTRTYSSFVTAAIHDGDSALQVGIDDLALAAAIVEKAGARGQSAIAVSELDQQDQAQTAVARVGTVVDVRLAALDALPFLPDSFDVIVVHGAGLAVELDDPSGRAILHDIHRVLRLSGRIVVVDGGTRDLLRRLYRRRVVQPATRLRTLRDTGFDGARLTVEQDGYRVFEAIKAVLDTHSTRA